MNVDTLASPAVWIDFVLSGAAERFKYVQPGLALVLVFVGVKMAVSDWVKIPVLASLGVIVLLVGGSIAASVVSTGRKRVDQTP